MEYEGVFGLHKNALIMEKKIPPTAMLSQLSDIYPGLALKYAHVKLGNIPMKNVMIDSRIMSSFFGGTLGIFNSFVELNMRTNLNPIWGRETPRGVAPRMVSEPFQTRVV